MASGYHTGQHITDIWAFIGYLGRGINSVNYSPIIYLIDLMALYLPPNFPKDLFFNNNQVKNSFLVPTYPPTYHVIDFMGHFCPQIPSEQFASTHIPTEWALNC